MLHATTILSELSMLHATTILSNFLIKILKVMLTSTFLGIGHFIRRKLFYGAEKFELKTLEILFETLIARYKVFCFSFQL
jgi:hypothetical protein